MKRLRCFILVFILALAIPLAYVTWQTYAGLAQEELAQLRYFSEALFDDFEQELAELIQNEESRSVEEYHHTLVRDSLPPLPSPLSQIPSEPYILGYLQNNPDGSFQSPMVVDLQQVSEDLRSLVDQLEEVNRVFNQKKFSVRAAVRPVRATESQPDELAEEKIEKVGLADRYLSRREKTISKDYLGNKETRTEEITVRQAFNLASEDEQRMVLASEATPSPDLSVSKQKAIETEAGQQGSPAAVMPADSSWAQDADKDALVGIAGERFQVEVAPFQSVFISPDQVFIFRRIAINNQIYRQGLVVLVSALLQDLAENQFRNQPLSDFMTLHMQIMNHGQHTDLIQMGPTLASHQFETRRRFPAPFDFFTATLKAQSIPASPARRPLSVAVGILGAVVIAGLIAIYHSARTIVVMSERRSQFVSSVTHELKTPLTNIRMYIEMLEQGIAATPQREQEYLSVLDVESARLSHLINNVLELAKLEKKQRCFHYQPGDLADVFSDVNLLMAQQLKQEGFDLVTNADQLTTFNYDREVLTQLMVNLIENSIKFGKHAPLRQITISVNGDDDYVRLSVSDTGPGIPRRALKQVFNDFFRVDNELTRTTSGTGIGLALVKKFVEAMGGQVRAANNTGPGCTITLYLPTNPVQF